MDQEGLKKLIEEVLDKNKWKDIIDHFVEVLKINIFLVDFNGLVVVPPQSRLGWPLFERGALGGKLSDKKQNILDRFRKVGDYLEFRCVSGLQCFAVPITIEQTKTIIYLMVGPVILNRRENKEFYEQVAKTLKVRQEELWEAANELRVVSNLTMKSILDLLAQVGHEVIELNLEKKKLSQMRIDEQMLPTNVSEAAQEIYGRIHLDELLVTLLDIALKMTNAECGSIMVVEEGDELVIKAARGLDEDRIQNARIKLGEGIAGIAAKENSCFVIHGMEGESRIKNYLARPDIQHAVVMPLSAKNRVFGVLNLHTKKVDHTLEGLDNLQYLSKLIVAAFQSI